MNKKGINKLKIKIYPEFKKNSDFIFALFLIFLLSPLLLILSFLVYLNFGTPIIFSQKRLGFKNKIFTIYKFRSMNDKYDKNGLLLPDNLRITKFGSWLRSSSMDELPELFNILRGEMSIVGPRPFISKYKKFYNKEELRRHNVRPGITGLAQIKGRNLLSWEEKFHFDIIYVDNYNLILDLKIMFKTILKVFNSEGISSRNLSQNQEFKRDL
ncbi:sugar transferase [uncultured Prochlorococcus sp.]|uniref:sugar transferase n=1 Tax=uncultured Prochlorococcus sp. TaxID=159733 RepID=UPI00258F9E23|nr:sugar transferase [uncultured Prochlorococcus sp.]